MVDDKSGYVYILTSKNCESIKIGGSDYPPMKRIREINNSEPYKKYGVWHLQDFRQVNDWRLVEYNLHYQFRSFLNREILQQKELFNVAWQMVSASLNKIDENLIVKKPKVDRMFQDNEFKSYLLDLFEWAGLNHWLDYQGAWSLVLFPATAGGRYFTLNIGRHEVAYSSLPKKNNPSVHMILLDELIFAYENVQLFLEKHNGDFYETPYSSAMERSVCAIFEGDFNVASEFLGLYGVRRALIAYWHEALFRLKINNATSTYSRFHDYNAIARLINDVRD